MSSLSITSNVTKEDTVHSYENVTGRDSLIMRGLSVCRGMAVNSTKLRKMLRYQRVLVVFRKITTSCANGGSQVRAYIEVVSLVPYGIFASG